MGAGLDLRSGLRRELYAVDRLVCVVSPGHPLTQEPETPFQKVLAHDLVSLDRNSSNFLYLSHQARLIGVPMQVRVHVHNFNALMYMVKAGVGAAIVPFSTAQEALRQGLVAALPLTDSWAARELYLVHANAPDQAELMRSSPTF